MKIIDNEINSLSSILPE